MARLIIGSRIHLKLGHRLPATQKLAGFTMPVILREGGLRNLQRQFIVLGNSAVKIKCLYIMKWLCSPFRLLIVSFICNRKKTTFMLTGV